MLEFALITRLECCKKLNLLLHKKDNNDSICDMFMGVIMSLHKSNYMNFFRQASSMMIP